MSHAFSDQAIKGLERYILANVRTACGLLGENIKVSGEKDGWGERRNVADWCNWMVFDIMGDLVFGKAFGMLESPTNRFAVDLVGNAAHRHLIVSTLALVSIVIADVDSVEPISRSTTGILTRYFSGRLLLSAASTCSTASRKPWSGPRWDWTLIAKTSSTTS
jgi:hypothetical protein